MAEVQLATLAGETREAIDSQDFARAAGACRRALLRFPRWVEGYWLLGRILVESGYVAQARSCFEAVASALPDDARAYEGLAAAAEQQHDTATAAVGLFRAIEVGESSQSVYDEFKRAQRQAGLPEGDEFTDARVAHARLIAGQYEEADSAAQRALADEPDRLDLLAVQASARLFGGDRKGSQRVCQRLLDLSPDCLKALAILRYLLPGDQTTALMRDLDALDPEGQTLVWLHGQMTTLGYDAEDLPSAPRLVRWQDDDESVSAGASRQMEQLIPELEEVWPQWLQEATKSASAPTGPTAEGAATAPSEPAPPAVPPTLVGEAAPPSFLGDMDALVREFEEAMRTEPPPPTAQGEAPPAPETIAAERAGEGAATEAIVAQEFVVAPSGSAEDVSLAAPGAEKAEAPAERAAEAASAPSAGTAVAAEWQAWEAERPAPTEEPPGETPEPPPVAPPADAIFAPPAVPESPASPRGDQFGDWVLSLAPLAATDEVVDLQAGAETGAAPSPVEQSLEVAPGAAPQAELPLPAPPGAAVPPDTEAPNDSVDEILQAAQVAARSGDYWSAIARYGEALGRLRASSPSGW